MIILASLLCFYYTDIALLINRSRWEGPCSFFLPFWHPRVMMYSWTLMIECWLPLPGHTRHFHTYLFSTASSCLAPALGCRSLLHFDYAKQEQSRVAPLSYLHAQGYLNYQPVNLETLKLPCTPSNSYQYSSS